MKWRSPRFLIALSILGTLLLIGCVVFLISYAGHFQKQSINPTPTVSFSVSPAVVYSLDSVPTPGASRTTYSNAKYGYSFVYPTEWKLKEFTFQKVDRITAYYQVSTGGDTYPFEMGCMANPNGLDAQSWVKQNDNGGTPIGLIRLKSGETAFLSLGHGQLGTNVYTLTHSYAVCQFAAVQSNQANAPIIDNVVNTFRWR